MAPTTPKACCHMESNPDTEQTMHLQNLSIQVLEMKPMAAFHKRDWHPQTKTQPEPPLTPFLVTQLPASEEAHKTTYCHQASKEAHKINEQQKTTNNRPIPKNSCQPLGSLVVQHTHAYVRNTNTSDTVPKREERDRQTDRD